MEMHHNWMVLGFEICAIAIGLLFVEVKFLKRQNARFEKEIRQLERDYFKLK